MKTAHEIDREGNVLRVFHRTSTMAWTHAPGERYSYVSSSHDRGFRGQRVEPPCSCTVAAETGPTTPSEPTCRMPGGSTRPKVTLDTAPEALDAVRLDTDPQRASDEAA
jgi:hypothetical protein